jgi:hypothetical protein
MAARDDSCRSIEFREFIKSCSEELPLASGSQLDIHFMSSSVRLGIDSPIIIAVPIGGRGRSSPIYPSSGVSPRQ